MKNENGLELHENKVVCPICDGNGLIANIYVKKILKNIYICDECNVMWEEGDNFIKSTLKDSKIYLENNNCTYDDISFTDADYHWYK